jgi:hypothetical protein
VTTLLKEKGIDLDNNRFLILQVGEGRLGKGGLRSWPGPGLRGQTGSGGCRVWPPTQHEPRGARPGARVSGRCLDAASPHPSDSASNPLPPNPDPSQGEVEQISLMRPKAEPEGAGRDTSPGLLEYLEDIIGTDKLVPQIEEEGKK